MGTKTSSVKYSEAVLDKYRYVNTEHHEWWGCVYEDWKQRLEELGFFNIHIYFSGFASQGDGACFAARHNGGKITTSGRYCHENTMRCDESDQLLEFAKALACDIYKDLEKEYDYQTSDEAVSETIEINQYEVD
jgi:hypothetical protein